MHGLGQQALSDYVDQYRGIRLSDRIILRKPEGGVPADTAGTAYFDAVTKATVSIIVINDSVLYSALRAARRTLPEFSQSPPSIVRPDVFTVLDWQQLLDQGLVSHWRIRRGDIEAVAGYALDDYPETLWSDNADARSTDIYFAFLNAPTIGRNLLGEAGFTRLKASLRPNESAVLVMSSGFYDVVAPGFTPGSIPERFNLLQNGLPVPIRDIDFFDTGDTIQLAGVSMSGHARILRIRPSSGFDPGAPMQLKLRFDLKKNHLVSNPVTMTSSYQLPAGLVTRQPVTDEKVPVPTWLTIWQSRWLEIVTLSLSLILLTGLFIYQRSLMRSIRHFQLIRWGFLLFTLFFIGFHAQGQLSVVNIFTLLTETLEGFDLAVFLLDPVIFILWSFTALTLVIWGRGVYCGWLCPFGALQEMLAWIAARLRIRQWQLSPRWHQRLLKVKYLLLISLTLISLYSLDAAMHLSEVEPFKTAITLFLIREWPFVLYALLLLALGLFVNKFYCRYLCALGAGLALVGKLHRLEMIRRRPECGSRCQMCRNRCQVAAIDTSGAIDYDECVQCLECLAIINDPNQCAIDLLDRKRARRATVQPSFAIP